MSKKNKKNKKKVENNIKIKLAKEEMLDVKEPIPVFDNSMEINYNESDPLRAMELISTSADYSENLLKYADPKISENQFKLFIIAQCKREMYKLVQYSRWLDIMEKRFEQISINRANELSPGQVMSIIKFLKDNIQASNDMLNNVIKDKDITNVLIINSQTNNINDITKSELLQRLYKSSADKAESPAASRSKVVEVVTEILKDDMSGNEVNEVVDLLTKPQEDNEELNGGVTEVVEENHEESVEPIKDKIENEQTIEKKDGNVENKVEVNEEQNKNIVGGIDFSKYSNEEMDQMLKFLENEGRDKNNGS